MSRLSLFSTCEAHLLNGTPVPVRLQPARGLQGIQKNVSPAIQLRQYEAGASHSEVPAAAGACQTLVLSDSNLSLSKAFCCQSPSEIRSSTVAQAFSQLPTVPNSLLQTLLSAFFFCSRKTFHTHVVEWIFPSWPDYALGVEILPRSAVDLACWIFKIGVSPL
jgi:hypothetical protein